MFDFLFRMEASVYIQVIILILLLAYFFGYRKDPRHLVSGVSVLRTITLVLIFFYFLWNWASSVSPALRNVSVLGMFIINLYMLWNVILTRLERPYRDALEACGQNLGKPEEIQTVWRTGKTFAYVRYFPQALFSGSSPFKFLHGIAAEQVRQDLKEVLHRHGISKDLISLQTQVTFLKDRLAADETLPPEFKETMLKAIAQFSQHPWIEEQVNQFLTTVQENPETLIRPGEAAGLEEIIQSPADSGAKQ
jgi:hypothetical protein